MSKDIEDFWNGLFSKDVLLRFKVTDKEKAMAFVGKHMGPNSTEDIMPGLAVTDIILHDNSKQAADMMREVLAICEKYKGQI